MEYVKGVLLYFNRNDCQTLFTGAKVHKTICIIGNRLATLEARLFTRAICKKKIFDSCRLITQCASTIEMIAFEEWKRSKRVIDLVLPSKWMDNPTSQQKKIISDIQQLGGKLIDFTPPENNTDSALMTTIHNADLTLVMEISRDHPVISASLHRKTSAAFQWAITNQYNDGCRQLLETGRVTPIYPPYYSEQLSAFIKGETFFSETYTQPKLNL